MPGDGVISGGVRKASDGMLVGADTGNAIKTELGMMRALEVSVFWKECLELRCIPHPHILARLSGLLSLQQPDMVHTPPGQQQCEECSWFGEIGVGCAGIGRHKPSISTNT